MRCRTVIATMAATMILGGAVGLAASPSQGATGPVSDPGPCPGQYLYPWMGESTYEPIQIQSLEHGGRTYAGTALRPADPGTYPPAQRPIVLLQHGNNGTQCALWWAARFLAGHGYVTMVWSSSADSGEMDDNFHNAVDAIRSAAALAESGSRPYPAWSDPGRIGLAGDSLGAIAVSCVQGDVDPAIKAAVGLDNLVSSIPAYPASAPGAPAAGAAGGRAACEQSSGIEIDPRIPAFGFAHDGPGFGKDPGKHPRYEPDAKLDAFKLWRSSNLPAMELVMRGFEHTDFMAAGSPEQHLEVGYFLKAWLDLWVGQEPGAVGRLLDTCVDGHLVANALSTHYHSAAFSAGQLPENINTTDYVSWLNDQPPDPDCAGG